MVADFAIGAVGLGFDRGPVKSVAVTEPMGFLHHIQIFDVKMKKKLIMMRAPAVPYLCQSGQYFPNAKVLD